LVRSIEDVMLKRTPDIAPKSIRAPGGLASRRIVSQLAA
jgi:hypothetical protein